MDTVRLGRRLGIGTRVVAKMLRGRAQNAADAVKNGHGAPFKPTLSERERVERAGLSGDKKKPIDTRTVTRNITRGAVRGGQGFWKPFARIVHALWHEVTGVFFALFALFFVQSVWRLRGSWRSGREHSHFGIYLLLALVFIYFSVTAFVTSRRHQP